MRGQGQGQVEGVRSGMGWGKVLMQGCWDLTQH